MRFTKGSIEALEHMKNLRNLKTGGSFKSDKIARIMKNNPSKFNIDRVSNPSKWLLDKYKKKVEIMKHEPIEEVYIPEEVYEPKVKHFFSDWLGINESSKEDHAVNSYEVEYWDTMYNMLDNFVLYDDVKNQDILIDDKVLNYLSAWIDKKLHAGHTAEYTDFVSLVVYPMLVKLNPKKDKFYIMCVANDLANDGILSHGIEPKPNAARVLKTFLKPKQPVIVQLFKKLPEIKVLYNQYLDRRQNVNAKNRKYLNM